MRCAIVDLDGEKDVEGGKSGEKWVDCKKQRDAWLVRLG